MTYQEFECEILSRLSKRIPDSLDIQIRTITKNNGIKLHGLLITDPVEDITPTIYLEPFFGEYLDESSKNDSMDSEAYIDGLCDRIYTLYEEHKHTEMMDIELFYDFDSLSDRIVFRLVNTRLNQELLADVPHMDYLDLSILFYYLLDTDDDDFSASILIHNTHMNYWNVTAEDLYAKAIENTPRLLHYKLSDMGSIIAELSKKSDLEIEESFYPMYVLSNNRTLYGACCILYQNLLSHFSEHIHGDFYVIPSSIHEVILLPTSAVDQEDDLNDIIRQVNQNEVSPEEILSDHVYRYSMHSRQLSY